VRELVRACVTAALADDLGLQRLVEQVEHGVLVVPGDRAHDVQGESTGHRGCGRQHAVGGLGETIETATDHLADPLRQVLGNGLH
jgi:hypothetical protein